jgi:hypothetical protein
MGGLAIREIPIHSAYSGKVFWVYNGTAPPVGQRGGSEQQPRHVQVALFDRRLCGDARPREPRRHHHGQARPRRDVSDATSFAAEHAGVAVVGLGAGSLRPTFTLDTANTATIPVRPPTCAFKNCIFKANFLSIAACFTVATAKRIRRRGLLLRGHVLGPELPQHRQDHGRRQHGGRPDLHGNNVITWASRRTTPPS